IAADSFIALTSREVVKRWQTGAAGPFVIHSTLPTASAAKNLLNTTHRHREWVNLPVGDSVLRVFIVYPERSDKAPVVLLTAKNEGASDWIRAVGDQVAAEGFIAAVPDLLSGMGPNGGDSESFADPAALAAVYDRLGKDEIARRINAARHYAIGLPAANGKSASLELERNTGIEPRIE